MPISPIVLQRRQAELGRIRLGQKNPEKGFPMKLDRFRFTSVSEQYVRDLADLYGGTAQAWDNNGIPSWEVITEATSIPVIVVKNGMSQWMEFWAGGGCMHRCDGVTNMLTGDPCDTEEKVQVGKKKVNPHTEAKPTTRLSVMLPELEAIGVFRLETHGWNAAAEIPAVAELAQFVGDLVPAVLHLVERRAIKDGQTSRFVVPVLDLQIGAAKLREIVEAKSGIGNELEAGASSGAAAIEAKRPDYLALATEAGDVDAVREQWTKAADAGHLTDDLKQALTDLAKTLHPTDDQEPVEGEPVLDPPDVLWQKCVTVAGTLGWTTDQLELALKSDHDATPWDATSEQLDALLTTLEAEAA
ncbi:hypothetical protein [Aeromicrobium sp. 9AM]|uniref:recombination directionality factor n=1 Tax=Aeromicrobium sp. 9AM TaxID=2653126 RepID=UPI0012F0A19A|nr:hypothetical protein [Aeromicrobium sp. 9AM]VXB83110.1 conserved hypothetical protein [Aeromicrobium sp. 9AM]